MKDFYECDTNFKEAFEACKNPTIWNKSPWLEYMTQDQLLLKNSQFVIPKYSLREKLIKENHN